MNNSKEVFEMNTVSFNSLGDLGRLGNQMFQYAALISIAVSNGYNFLIPDPEKVNFRHYTLQDTFRLNSINKAENYGISDFDNFINDKVTNDIEFHESYNNLIKNVNLHGYFQSYRFIEPVIDLIQKDFQFNETVKSVAEKILTDELIDPKNYTFIHIRRGDYISKKEYHYNLDKSYYKKSAGLFPDTTKFLVFSDDVTWCKNNLVLPNKLIFFEDLYSEDVKITNKESLELFVMSKCNGGIIANSSFSWWGAFLQNGRGKIVSPSSHSWFGYKYEFNAKELIYSHWVQVNPSIIKLIINLIKKTLYSLG